MFNSGNSTPFSMPVAPIGNMGNCGGMGGVRIRKEKCFLSTALLQKLLSQTQKINRK